MAPVVIKNGRIITAVDDYTADILMEEERVQTIGRDIPVGADVEVHDAAGLLVLPGGVDVHTHLDWEFGTGTQAAAFGGTTTLVDFADQKRGQSPLAGLEDWHQRAQSASVDGGAHMILTDVTDQTLEDMKTLIAREGVSSFKLFMAYPGVLMVDDASLFKAMRTAGSNGAMVCARREWPGYPGPHRRGPEPGSYRSQIPYVDSTEPDGGRSDPPCHPHLRASPNTSLYRPPLGPGGP